MAFQNKIIVLIGLPGSGKTTIGQAIAADKKTVFFDFDVELPQSLKNKMANGEVISDSEREDFFKEFISKIKKSSETNPVIAACVLVKEKHRLMFHDFLPNAKFIHLVAPKEILVQRIKSRQHAFLNPVILDRLIAQQEAFKIPHKIMDGSAPQNDLIKSIQTMML